jgi:outer membrane protein OmpA-like peptidoglycan-associated protein
MRLGLRVLVLAVTLVTALAGVRPAAADPTQIGLWIGPRVFSTDSLLGYIDDAPQHPMLANDVEFGVRAGKPFFPWLVPELELAMSPTHTDGQFDVSVFWMEPRIQLRFELLPQHRIMPFVVVGGGALIALSSARKTFDSDLLGDGYVGAGLRFDTHKGFGLRFDARLAIVPGVEHAVTTEAEFGIGLELHTHEVDKVAAAAARAAANAPPPDRDNDGIPDTKDQCPDRPEDKDGFQDADGCPDIDNDLDGILDIADKCPDTPENYNGFEDEDGCPDTLPQDVDSLKGTVEGLIYAAGETTVHDSAEPSLQRIVTIMKAHPGIKVVLIGHTDDREAAKDGDGAAANTGTGSGGPGDSDAVDLATASDDLSRARAEAVRQALIKLGVASGRISIDGRGNDEPVADNDTPRHRLANRRVEIKLFVPKR